MSHVNSAAVSPAINPLMTSPPPIPPAHCPRSRLLQTRRKRSGLNRVWLQSCDEILVDPLGGDLSDQGNSTFGGLSGQSEVFRSTKTDATDSHSADFRLFNVAVILMRPVYI